MKPDRRSSSKVPLPSVSCIRFWNAAVWSRTGHFDRDDFQAIFSFSTPAAVYALGTAVSECSRDVLRNIERTVKTTIRRRNAERSQHEYEQQERDLLDYRGLPAPEPDPAAAEKALGKVRQTAPDLPDAASPGAVQFDAPVGELCTRT